MASRAGGGGAIQQSLGIPPGTKTFSPFPFAGMNLKSSPTAIGDSEFLWCENFVRLGDGNLRTLWDVGTPIYSAPSNLTIVMHFFYTIGTSYYAAIFLSDGSALQIDTNTLAQTQIGPAGTFYSPGGQLPGCSQWGTLYLLISNRNTVNDYWAWDGSILYTAGTAAPNGVNLLATGLDYASTPTVTPFGGHGSGLVVTPTINAGGVVELTITDPGVNYQVGDIVQLAFSGGGSDTSAILEANLNNGGVAAVNVTNGGTGYTSAPTVGFSGGGGTGAAGTAILGGGVASVTVNTGGSGYTSATVSFDGGGGSGAEATATVSTGVATVTVTIGGSGYATPPTVGFVGGGGTGATATATVSAGAVTAIAVGSAGSGYVSPPTVTLTGGGGSGAAAVATIQNGAIASIAITNSGSGYTSAPTVTVSGDGTGATATAVLASTSSVTGVLITNPGSGYTSAPTVSFTGGGGASAAGVAILDPSSIVSATVVDPGSGFTYAPGISFVGGGGSGATGVVNLTPTSVARIDIVAGGSGYEAIPTVKFTANPGAVLPTGYAVLNQGQVVEVVLTSAGANITTNVYVYFDTGFTGKVKDGTLQIGKGTGAQANAILQPTTIASVTISSAGKNYTDAPAIEIAPGANHSAYATVSLMPFGVSGSAIETYQQRVWISNPHQGQFQTTPPGGNFQVSSPGSILEFATSLGGVQFTSTDRFLQTRYVGMRQSNGYLYAFGDGSVSIISSVNTSGDPATTSFNYQNVDPQTGLSFRDSMQDFGKTILFANETGIFGIYGGAATLASANLQELFTNAIFPPTTNAILPSSATATLFNLKHYLMLMTVYDPDVAAYRNVMATWNERDWTISTQSSDLTYISTQKVSSKFTTWGTDGRSLFPLFARPSASLVKRLDTKLYGGAGATILIKNLTYFWMQAQDRSSNRVGIDCTVEFDVSGIALQPLDDDLGQVRSGVISDLLVLEPIFPAGGQQWPVFGTSAQGLPFMAIGARLSTSSPDFVISNLMLGYQDFKGLL